MNTDTAHFIQECVRVLRQFGNSGLTTFIFRSFFFFFSPFFFFFEKEVDTTASYSRLYSGNERGSLDAQGHDFPGEIGWISFDFFFWRRTSAFSPDSFFVFEK